MIGLSLFNIFLLSCICILLAWITPKKYAFDAISVWTLVCIFAMSPPTAVWLLLVAFLLPTLLPLGSGAKGATATIICALLVAGLVMSRVLPIWAWIGGAFFTLRGIHVVVEWWMGRLPPPSLRESLNYFLFLPVLAVGPINRMPCFQHQIRRRRWDWELFLTGAERILLGFVFLYVIASRFIGKLANEVSSLAIEFSPFLQVWLTSAISWLELFFVFAGATHVALGISMMIGLKLEENFNRPWAARDLTEFWTRWHISLTRWVQDYIFRPITAITHNPILALIISMLIIGLWHEFSAYYVLWSFWQSLGIIVSRLMSSQNFIPSFPAKIALVFGPFAVLAWLSAARPVILSILGDLG